MSKRLRRGKRADGEKCVKYLGKEVAGLMRGNVSD